MTQPKGIVDDYGVLMECHKILPDDSFRIKLIAVLAELQNNESHVQRNFPASRLHKIEGVEQAIYRADIDKISGWRLHLQYDKVDKRLHLIDVITGQKHDDVIKAVKAKKGRYKK